MGHEKQTGIQAARTVAALGIVYFHSWVAITRFPAGTDHSIYWLKTYGWLSVDLFFAISGYVIGLVIDRGLFSPRAFMIKRLFRIYPLWLLTLTAFAITAALWRGLLPSETWEFFLYSAALLPTYHFPFYNIGWTLQHEMVFYALASIAVPFVGLRGLAAVLLISTLGAHEIDLQGIPGLFASHHGEFAAGLLVYLFREQLSRFGFVAPLAGGASLLGYLAANNLGCLFPFALFLLVAAFSNLQVQWRPVLAIGDASFSIYLIHPLVFMGASAVVSKFHNLPLWSEEPIRFLCIALAIGASLLSLKWFEKPTIALGSRLASNNSHNVVAGDRGLDVVVR